MITCLALDNAEKQLVAAVNTIINEYSLPCYLLEPICDKVHRVIRDGKEQELAAARQAEEANGDG